MRTAMPLLEQIDALRRYKRTLQADINRASQEQGAQRRKRRISPFVHNLRFRRLFSAYELHDIADECLNRLRHARALSVAEFAPGDVVAVTVVMPGRPRSQERYVIYDVEPSNRDGYCYEAWQLTKTGRLFQRGPTWVCPSKALHIVPNRDPLPRETLEECEEFRRRAQLFAEETLSRGSLEGVIKVVRERRERRGW